MSDRTAPQSITDGPRVGLRLIRDSDLPRLYEAAIAPESSFRWRYNGAVPDPSAFGRDLWRGVLAQYVAVEHATGELLAHLVSYRENHVAGHCYVGVNGLRDIDRSGLMMESFAVFMCYLFQHWPFQKIYAEVPEFNLETLGSGVERYFETEGILRSYHYYDGKYWDVHLIASERAVWDEVRSRLAAMRGIQGSLP